MMRLDTPMAAIDLQELRGCFFLWGAIGHAVGVLNAVLAGLFVHDVALDEQHLLDAREVDVRIERARCPDVSRFDTTVTAVGGGKRRRAALRKQQRDIGFERGLIVFDGEVVIGAVVDQVAGERVLRM